MVERVLKKYTQVKVPLPSKKISVSRVKILVQKTTWVRVAYLKVLMSIEYWVLRCGFYPVIINAEHMQFRHLKIIEYSVIHIILFVIKNIYHPAVLILTAHSIKYIKTAWKQYSVKENMKVILSTSINHSNHKVWKNRFKIICKVTETACCCCT